VNPSNVRVGMPLLKDSRSDDRAIVSADLFQLEIVPGPIVLLLGLKILHTLIVYWVKHLFLRYSCVGNHCHFQLRFMQNMYRSIRFY
jgi:hypothetical protein